MPLSVLSEWEVANTTVRYLNDTATGAVTLQLVSQCGEAVGI